MANIIQTFPKGSGSSVDEFTEEQMQNIIDHMPKDFANIETGGGSGGTTNYDLLSNKPTVNGHELSGDMTSEDLDITDTVPEEFTEEQMENIISNISSRTNNVTMKPYHIYSPEEEIVGEWREYIDGVLKYKPIYEKKYTGLSISIPANEWARNAIIDSSFDLLIEADTWFGTDKYYPKTAFIDKSTHGLYLLGNGDARVIDTVILQYTKSTDSWQAV